MATLHDRDDEPTARPSDNAYTALAADLRARLLTADTSRFMNASGTGHFASPAATIERHLDAIERGDPVTINSLKLPAPFRAQWKPPRYVTVHPDGRVVTFVRSSP